MIHNLIIRDSIVQNVTFVTLPLEIPQKSFLEILENCDTPWKFQDQKHDP